MNTQEWDAIPQLNRQKIFFIDEVRSWSSDYKDGKISLSKFVELLNEKTYDWIDVKVGELKKKQQQCVLQNPAYYNSGAPLESMVQGIDTAITLLTE